MFLNFLQAILANPIWKNSETSPKFLSSYFRYVQNVVTILDQQNWKFFNTALEMIQCSFEFKKCFRELSELIFVLSKKFPDRMVEFSAQILPYYDIIIAQKDFESAKFILWGI